MLARIKPRITYANFMSTLAVFMVLGGGAYAAATLPKNSVGSKQLKKNAVTSAKVKNGTLTAKDAKAGQFAVPANLSKLLPVGGTAVNSNALGGIGSGGYVHGAGKLVSGAFSGTANSGTLVPVPGGGSIQVNCGNSGYVAFFSRPTGGTRVFDVFREVAVDNLAQRVSYVKLQPNTIQIFGLETDNSRTTIDVSSDAGYAHVTVFVHQDSGTKVCTETARGVTNP